MARFREAEEVAFEQFDEGDRVVFEDPRGRTWKGKLLRVAGSIWTIRLDEPIPFLDAPDAILHEEVRDEDVTATTRVLGYGLMQAFSDHDIKPPPGRWSHDKRKYMLKKPTSLAKIREFCAANYPQEALCVLQAMILKVISIDTLQGITRKA
jgi:hypothetical protein